MPRLSLPRPSGLITPISTTLSSPSFILRSASSSSSSGPSKTLRPRDDLPKSTLSALTHKPIESSFAASRKGKSKADPIEILPLPRPLGVHAPPIPSDKSWSSEISADERARAKRAALLKEASRGYFHDYNRASRERGGKLYIAPPVLIREDRALYFPNIAGKNLNGEKANTTEMLQGRISLVTILNTRLSDEHVQSFISPVLEDQGGKSGFNHIQINHQQNPLKSMLLNFFLSSLRRTIPQSRWDNYLLASGEWSEVDVNEPLGLENKILGYVFLVDSSCKVRWAGNGQAEEKEVKSLREATAVLMKRWESSSGSIS